MDSSPKRFSVMGTSVALFLLAGAAVCVLVGDLEIIDKYLSAGQAVVALLIGVKLGQRMGG